MKSTRQTGFLRAMSSVIDCHKCGASISCLDHSDGAIESKWNTRTPQSEWISVDDELPKAYEEVYTYPRPDFGIDCHVGEVDSNGVWTADTYNSWGNEKFKVRVTHWSPLKTEPTK
jgi:hypothetical protein